MEFLACLLGGAALVACGFWLFRLQPPDWRNEDELADENPNSMSPSIFQRNIRYLNNALLAGVGAGIMASAFVPHGHFWMLLWTSILVLLLICILFAMVDALTSLAGYRRALPEAARRALGNESMAASECQRSNAN